MHAARFHRRAPFAVLEEVDDAKERLGLFQIEGV
jgi:hypothetical protein